MATYTPQFVLQFELEALNSSFSQFAHLNTGDDSFAPSLPGKTGFDFMLLFEESIFSILPAGLLLPYIPWRILCLWKERNKVSGGLLQLTKIGFLAILSALQIANVIETSKSAFQIKTSLPAAIVTLCATLGLCVLSYLEHLKSIRPSATINLYLLFTIPFDGATLRTHFLRSKNQVPTTVLAAILVVKTLVFVTEAAEKRGILLSSVSKKDLSPEATSGMLSQWVFWWLNPLFWLGLKSNIRDGDLFAVDNEMISRFLRNRFGKFWNNRTHYPQRHVLFWVTLMTVAKPFAEAVPMRIALMFFRFMQPFLIRSLTTLVKEPASSETTNQGWGLTAAFGIVYTGLAITSGAYQHKSNRLSTMVRGSLVTAIYSKTLDLSLGALDESAAVTLMSSDVERICEALLPIHSLWASPLEIVLAIWLLHREIGMGLFGPLVVTALAIAGPFLVSGHMGLAQIAWIQGVQVRIDVTAKMIHAMKGVKMLGLNDKISAIIVKLRIEEITKSLKMRKLFVVVVAFGNISDIFAPGAAFSIYVIIAAVNGQSLDVSSAFTALSLIALLVAPIRALVFTTPMLSAALGCFSRIEDFLSSSARKDHRLQFPESESLSIRVHHGILDATHDGETTVGSPETPSPLAVIQVKNLSLAWRDEDKPVISDLSIEFQSGSLTMVVGPIGCGKSSLLKAFVDQTPWIQNTTILRNITGVLEFEPEWYATVVHACALNTDFETMSHGDNTLVGSAGTTMSGGQKLRIALARAVYSRHRVLILDDVLSGLDAINEDRIFTRLLGNGGLLKASEITVIFVTHAAHRLSYADHIVALTEGGAISEQGKFSELIETNGYVSGLAARHTMERNEETDSTLPKPAIPIYISKDKAPVDSDRPEASWKIYSYYCRSVGWSNVVVWTSLMIFYSMLLRFPDLWIKYWTSAIAVHGNKVNNFYLAMLLVLEVIAMIALMSLVLLLFAKMIPRSALFFHDKLLQTTKNAPLAFFTSTDSGQILNRFSQDLSVIDMELPIAGLILSNQVCLAIIQALLIYISVSYSIILLPFVGMIVYIVQKFYLRTSQQIRLMEIEAKSPLYSNFLETLSGLVTIRAYGSSEKMEQRNNELLDTSQRSFYLLYCIHRWLAIVVDLLVAVLAIILVAMIVRFRDRSDAGFVGVALINIMSFNITLSQVITNWTTIETSLGAVSRIKSFTETTLSENHPEECQDVPLEWPGSGKITVSHLTAAYATDQEPVLRDINLSILPGQKLGICGPSGSGKSSFVAALLHMLEVQDGSIIIDDVDTMQIPRQTLRERIAVIPQDPVFLPGTIRENLDPFNLNISDAQAQDVLTKIGLWTIIANAGGLDTIMVAGDLLSHGQRQLFCLGRAMLKSCRVLILDEATASVDLATDRLMQGVIGEWFKGCTVVTVAHRLDTIREFDHIAVFRGGRIVEVGVPGELLEKEGGEFRMLWEA